MKVTACISIKINVDVGEYPRGVNCNKAIEMEMKRIEEMWRRYITAPVGNLQPNEVSIGSHYDCKYSPQEQADSEREDRDETAIRDAFYEKLDAQIKEKLPLHRNIMYPDHSPNKLVGIVSFITDLWRNPTMDVLKVLDGPYINKGNVTLVMGNHHSHVMSHPTVADIMIEFHRLCVENDDYHHVFLEKLTESLSDSNLYLCSTGS